MDALHGSDHAQFREARNVGWIDMLRMLDAPSQGFLIRMLLEDGFVYIQHFAICAITDGVDAELIAVGNRELRGLPYIGRILRREPRSVRSSRRQVGVRLQHPRAARPKRAIHHALDGPNGEVVVGCADGVVLAQIRS